MQEIKKLKTEINFADIEVEKETNWLASIPLIVIIVLLSVLFANYAVIGRFAKLGLAQYEVAQLQSRYEENLAKLNMGGDELTYKFNHYTWSYMDHDEVWSLSRVRILKILSFIDEHGVQVQTASLADKKLNLNVKAEQLQVISRLSEELNQLDEVESCAVSTARSDMPDGDKEEGTIIIARDQMVRAQLTINLRDYDEVLEIEKQREAEASVQENVQKEEAPQ